jgi:hypothetical protein
MANIMTPEYKAYIDMLVKRSFLRCIFTPTPKFTGVKFVTIDLSETERLVNLADSFNCGKEFNAIVEEFYRKNK